MSQNQKNGDLGSQGGNADVAASCLPLCEYVEEVLANYFANLGGDMPSGFYQMVLEQVERPLLWNVMRYVAGNQCKAAKLLGISRVTLRKKLKQYGL